ncbi:MAG TPA: orotidine-5'-phosphate decarboxylase [Phycisphaerae bacterium]|nr:orotidine-5'-phosphate decarboxylase [Phycisphaerae bacterium]
MAKHFADRMLDAIEAKQAPLCVGLDPMYERLPKQIREIASSNPAGLGEQAAAAREFCQSVIDIVAGQVPCVKLQSAYFERCGPTGMRAYFEVADYAHEQGLLVIGDVKRADIGSTAEAYAVAHLEEVFIGEGKDERAVTLDAATVNPYFGKDGVQPFIETAKTGGQGVFVVVRTTNPSAKDFQDFKDAEGRRVFERIAERVNDWANQEGCLGDCGYSLVGAVAAATYPEDTKLLRALMPNSLFLVPGVGAQGGSVDDATLAFHDDGWGALVTVSRSVIYAWERPEYQHLGEVNWEEAIEVAAVDMKAALAEALARRAATV